MDAVSFNMILDQDSTEKLERRYLKIWIKELHFRELKASGGSSLFCLHRVKINKMSPLRSSVPQPEYVVSGETS